MFNTIENRGFQVCISEDPNVDVQWAAGACAPILRSRKERPGRGAEGLILKEGQTTFREGCEKGQPLDRLGGTDGYVAKGVIYATIGVLAMQEALGAGGRALGQVGLSQYKCRSHSGGSC